MVFTGVNLGSWLLMEGYILGGRNIPEHRFKREFQRQNGKKALIDFEDAFRSTFIREEDIRRIASWGAKCVRVPFHYRLIEKAPYRYSKEGITLIRTLLDWADTYSLKVILDLHAACGSQNHDWHSDSAGKAVFWIDEKCQRRTYALWKFLAESLGDKPALYGYDVLNEPVLDAGSVHKLAKVYKNIIRAIRTVDPRRVIFLEGNTWAQEIDFLKEILGPNIAISIHTYAPLQFTFNFVRGLHYPGTLEGELWNRDRVYRYLEPYKRFSETEKVPMYVGEFGVNYREGACGEVLWLEDMLDVYKEFGFSWTYWTYKAVSNAVFPDGIAQYLLNPSWIRREGPLYGLENVCRDWKKHSESIIASWKTEAFSVRQPLLDVLKKYF